MRYTLSSCARLAVSPDGMNQDFTVVRGDWPIQMVEPHDGDTIDFPMQNGSHGHIPGVNGVIEPCQLSKRTCQQIKNTDLEQKALESLSA